MYSYFQEYFNSFVQHLSFESESFLSEMFLGSCCTLYINPSSGSIWSLTSVNFRVAVKEPYETSTVILSHFQVLIWDSCFPFEVRSFGIYRNFSLEPQEPFIHSVKCDYYVQDKIWPLEHQLLANKNRWCNMSLFQCTSTRKWAPTLTRTYSPVDVSSRQVAKTALWQNWVGFSRVDPTGWLAFLAAPTQL